MVAMVKETLPDVMPSDNGSGPRMIVTSVYGYLLLMCAEFLRMSAHTYFACARMSKCCIEAW